MPESTLSLNLDDLAGEVGLFLGWGRGANNGDTAWTSGQQAAITSCVKSGLRNFYFPPPIDGQETAYDWSFLKPIVTATFPSGASTLALPDDFGGFEGEITVSAAAADNAAAVSLVSEGQVRQQYAVAADATGAPRMAAIQPLRGTTTLSGQRFQFYLWPLADQAYTLEFAYYVNADYLSSGFPYHLGGMAHVETILESCLAIAEQRLDDAAGVHSMKFKERLLASIGIDRKMKPQTLGYNADRSDRRGRYGRGHMHGCDGSVVTYNDVEY